MDNITGLYRPGRDTGIGIIDTPLKYCVLVWVMICLCVSDVRKPGELAFRPRAQLIRHDRTRAQADGVNVPQLLSAAFAFSAAIAGSAGWLYAHYISYISPNSLDTHTSISAC